MPVLGSTVELVEGRLRAAVPDKDVYPGEEEDHRVEGVVVVSRVEEGGGQKLFILERRYRRRVSDEWILLIAHLSY